MGDDTMSTVCFEEDNMDETTYAKLGFPPLKPVATLPTVAHLFSSKRKNSRCGVYLLAFPDNTHYIGKAIEVVRRFSQHRQRHAISGFSFIPTREALLDRVEFDKIRLAENLGLRLINVVHTSVTAVEADLDLVLPPGEQAKWIGRGAYHFRRDRSPSIVLPQSHIDRFAPKFRQLLAHPMASAAAQLLRAYLINAIPSPRRTEYSFWNVSCMPSTGAPTRKRLFCVSAASMELFVLFCDKSDPRELSGFVTISVETLAALQPDVDAFKRRHPTVDFSIYPYQDAGEDQITLQVFGLDALKRLLADKAVQMAAGVLAQRVMRKRPTFYAQFHCPQLASLALDQA
jgi:hypothetical protein